MLLGKGILEASKLNRAPIGTFASDVPRSCVVNIFLFLNMGSEQRKFLSFLLLLILLTHTRGVWVNLAPCSPWFSLKNCSICTVTQVLFVWFYFILIIAFSLHWSINADCVYVWCVHAEAYLIDREARIYIKQLRERVELIYFDVSVTEISS